MLDDDAPEGEVRARAAHVNYDGTITVLLDVPGELEPVEHIVDGDRFTVLLTFHGQTLPVNLTGTTATDRRCLELVERGVRRLNEDLARKRRWRERLRHEHQEREDEIDGYGA